MSKNKYNIEEVFKSELEDFEMDLPQNLWSNVSNNITSVSKVAKTSFLGSSASTLSIVGVSLAIVAGAIIYSNSTAEEKTTISTEETKTVYPIEELETEKVLTINTITPKEEVQTAPTTDLDPIIEQSNKKKSEPKKQYIIKNSSEKQNESNVNDIKPTIAVKNPIKPIAPTESSTTKDLEITELKPTELIASISASPIGGHAPLSVNFSHQNQNVNTQWDFKDGTTSKEENVSHTFEEEGDYEVELTVTNKDGITKSTTKTISVLATSKINKIPNIFTPNNDGINDKFIINHENIEHFNLYIYAKSGEMIFESNDIEKGWDGNTQYEEKADAGNYIYVIKAKGTDGKSFEETGVVKLVR